MKTISFTDSDGKENEFYVEEQVRIGGTDYLLVSDSDEDEANALILKDISEASEEEARYVPVVDGDEFEALSRIFSELLEDTEIRM